MGTCSMPSIDAIVEYWREHHDEFPTLRSHDIGWGEPFCFACGWLAPVLDGLPSSWRTAGKWMDRAHLMNRCVGGPNVPANLVMLCHLCHAKMPLLEDRGAAVTWVRGRLRADARWQMYTDGQFFDRRDKPVNRTTTLVRTRMRWLESMRQLDQQWGDLNLPIADIND